MKKLQLVWWGLKPDYSLPRFGWVQPAPAFASIFKGSFSWSIGTAVLERSATVTV